MKKNNGSDARKNFRLIGLSGAFVAMGLLSGCGGDTLTTDNTDTPTFSSGVKTGPVHSITISYPRSNAIDDLGNGVYRRKVSVLVRDQQGIPLPIGTRIQVQIIDSILAQGTLDTGDSIDNRTVTLVNAMRANGEPIADLTTVTINRPGVQGGQARGIESGDLILLLDSAHNTDTLRVLSSRPQLANTIETSTGYTRDYPEYGPARYVIGASMLSAGVVGEIPDSFETADDSSFSPGELVVADNDGVATGWIVYAANVDNITAGCFPEADDRALPKGSGQVWLAATSGNITALEQLCFSPIAGFTVSPQRSELTSVAGEAVSTRICVTDGGDEVGVAIAPIEVGRPAGNTTVLTLTDTAQDNEGNHYTNRFGCFTAEFSEVQGGEADWIFAIGDDFTTIEVIGPEILPEEE